MYQQRKSSMEKMGKKCRVLIEHDTELTHTTNDETDKLALVDYRVREEKKCYNTHSHL